MQRAFLIAVQARRVSLLADRADLLYPDATERTRRAFAEGLHPLDVALVAGADEADRLCAVGVQMLRTGRKMGPIRDLLGSLTEDALLAVFHALPVERQHYCRRDAVWAYALARGPEDVPWHLAELENLRGETADAARLDGLPPEERADFNRFSENLLRRSLGMPYELSEQEEACAVAGERLVAGALADDGSD